ncbi:hypothetical protein MtrunA17_Chr8g0379841 [Medicago truncatula]|uniref:Uncharacterized protein n=1 Tax=Medicago truncatula TaxID=3880 RepID=A0A396GNR6_MEDTR|nr:hypothetical protein MtrunA17_Chr8g0379841 [Medicago truncatula]
MIKMFIIFFWGQMRHPNTSKNLNKQYPIWVVEASYIPSHCGSLQFRIAFIVINAQRIHLLYYE